MSSIFVGVVRPWPQELRRRPNDLFQNTLTRPTRNAAGQVGVQMGMYAPQRPPAAGVRPRPFPISSAPAFERPNAVRANRCADGRADGTWTAFLRRPPHVWDGETRSARSWRNQEVIALNPRQFRERWLNGAMSFGETVVSARFPRAWEAASRRF